MIKNEKKLKMKKKKQQFAESASEDMPRDAESQIVYHDTSAQTG